MLQWFQRQVNRFRCQKGQGMTEYIIIVAMIAIAALFVTRIFGDEIRGMFATAVYTIRGRGEYVVEDAPATDEAREKMMEGW